MLDLFSSKKKDLLIPSPENFSARYKMLTQNTFLMGAENKPLKMETVATLQLKQKINDNSSIETAVTLESIKGNTENKELQEPLDTALALSDISRTLLFQRNAHGKFTHIKNKSRLKNDWEKWKDTEINNLFKEKKQQDRFIMNYEKGFEGVDQTVPLSFQNAILIPALYGFKNYQSLSNCFSAQNINSKLIADLVIKYEMYAVNIKINSIGEAKIQLKSKLSNPDEMKPLLEKIYKNSKEFSIKNYQFRIYLDYVLERETGKILKSIFSLTEVVHDHLRYDLKIDLQETSD